MRSWPGTSTNRRTGRLRSRRVTGQSEIRTRSASDGFLRRTGGPAPPDRSLALAARTARRWRSRLGSGEVAGRLTQTLPYGRGSGRRRGRSGRKHDTERQPTQPLPYQAVGIMLAEYSDTLSIAWRALDTRGRRCKEPIRAGGRDYSDSLVRERFPAVPNGSRRNRSLTVAARKDSVPRRRHRRPDESRKPRRDA